MRTAAIYALLTVFFGFVFLFLVGNQSPLDTEKLMADLEAEQIDTQSGTIDYIEESIELGILTEYINFQSLLLAGIFFSATIFSFLSSAQILIDKLFFRKFYENPRYKIAYRRAGLVVAGIDSLVLLRILLGFDLIIAATIVLLFAIIELFMTFGSRQVEENKSGGTLETPEASKATKEAEDTV